MLAAISRKADIGIGKLLKLEALRGLMRHRSLNAENVMFLAQFVKAAQSP